jgi:hypothetical protein
MKKTKSTLYDYKGALALLDRIFDLLLVYGIFLQGEVLSALLQRVWAQLWKLYFIINFKQPDFAIREISNQFAIALLIHIS